MKDEFMGLPMTDNYQIKTSKTNHKIPVINGIHLHSMYHPIREAESFVLNHLQLLKDKKNILVFGLGFVYHINQLVIELQKIHGDDYKIVVIEPNSEVANDCLSLNLLISDKVKIYHGLSHDRLYQDEELINFLLAQPGIIAHPASFNLYKSYFKNFLQYKAPLSTEKVLMVLRDEHIKKFISDRFMNEDDLQVALWDYSQSNHRIVNKLDYLFFALEEIAPLNGDARK